MPKKTPKLPAPVVRIRMYRHGLGDSFLLRFTGTTAQPFHVVIDSGVIIGTAESGQRMREVAEDIARETNGRIDVLVVTHEHWDHVSGFTDARDVWHGITIDEIWTAWTEDPQNALARKLRAKGAENKAALLSKLAGASPSALQLDAGRSSRVAGLLGFFGLSLDGDEQTGGTAGALNYIIGRGKKRTYLKPGGFAVLGVPGVRTFVLGPPEDEKKINKSNPSKAHPEVYSDPSHAFAFSDGSVKTDLEAPFDEEFGEAIADVKQYASCMRRNFPALVAEDGDPAWRRLGFDDLAEIEALALALDSNTNNTSLALAFELGDGRVLLFPADAQVGNWLSWHDHTWKADGRTVTAEQLLAKTVLYKVGHHASHNATLKDRGLELMTHPDLIALAPVNRAMAVKKRWNMPFPPLYARLAERTRGRVILSDASEPLPAAEKLKGLTPSERAKFKESVVATDLYVDVTL